MKPKSLLKSLESGDSFFQEIAIKATDAFEALENTTSWINLEATNYVKIKEGHDDLLWSLTKVADLPDINELIKTNTGKFQKALSDEKIENESDLGLSLIFSILKTAIQIGFSRYFLTSAGQEVFPFLFISLALTEIKTDELCQEENINNAIIATRQTIKCTIDVLNIVEFPSKIKLLIICCLHLELSRIQDSVNFKEALIQKFVYYCRNKKPSSTYQEDFEKFLKGSSLQEFNRFLIYMKDHDIFLYNSISLKIFSDLFEVRRFVFKEKEYLLEFDNEKQKITENNGIILKALKKGPILPKEKDMVLPAHNQAAKTFNDFKKFCITKLRFDPHVVGVCYRLPNDIELIIDPEYDEHPNSKPIS